MPSLKAAQTPDGKVVLTRKFLSGMEEYAKLWQGRMRVIMEPTEERSDNLDNVELHRHEIPFTLRLLPFDAKELAVVFHDASLVVGTAHQHSHKMLAASKRARVPIVFIYEYSLQTRLQVVRETTPNLARRWRRYVWQLGQERRNLSTASKAAGIQCNGTPTYDAYNRYNPHSLLFFDTRVRSDMVITEGELERRLRRMFLGHPIRLAFSGRLDPIKGVKYLVPLARELRDRLIPFHLTIMGDGPEFDRVQMEVMEAGLIGHVDMTGTLQFETELVPTMKGSVDVFVCPHVQGDPSCTYLETLACGVPIVGFDNQAFEGLVRKTNTGWTTPMHDVRSLAAKIVEIAANKMELAQRSRAARRFALQHTMEKTFAARVEHLRASAKV